LAPNNLKSLDFLSRILADTNKNTNISQSRSTSKKTWFADLLGEFKGRAVARRLDPDARQEAWHVHFGDVRLVASRSSLGELWRREGQPVAGTTFGEDLVVVYGSSVKEGYHARAGTLRLLGALYDRTHMAGRRLSGVGAISRTA
jgi:hypothetical protein